MSLIEQYEKTIPNWMNEQGVYPTPAIIRLNDEKLEFAAMAIEVPEVIPYAIKTCKRPEVAELIVALDTFTQPGQGTTLDSCLILFHLVRGQPTQIGVLEYSWNGGEPVTKPADWDNAFWRGAYAPLARELTEAFKQNKGNYPA